MMLDMGSARRRQRLHAEEESNKISQGYQNNELRPPHLPTPPAVELLGSVQTTSDQQPWGKGVGEKRLVMTEWRRFQCAV